MAPLHAPDRWRHYAVQVGRRGLPIPWLAFSFLFGLGAIPATVALVNLSWAWIVVSVITTMMVVVVGGGYRIWDDVERSLRSSSEQVPAIDQVKLMLAEGYSLESDLRADYMTDARSPIHDDPVYQWGLKVWRILRTNYPLQARVFFGEAPYQEGYFMVAYSAAISTGRNRYLDQRLRLLELLVNQHAGGAAQHLRSVEQLRAS